MNQSVHLDYMLAEIRERHATLRRHSELARLRGDPVARRPYRAQRRSAKP